MKKKFFPIIILILAFTGFISTQIIWDMFQLNAEQTTENSNKYLLFETNLKNLKTQTIDNKYIDGGSLKMPIIVLNFWASWCLPCLKEFPSLVEFNKRYAGKIQTIGINGDEDKPEEAIKRMTAKYSLNFDQVIDKNSEISDQYLVTAYPFTVIYVHGKVAHVSLKTMDFMSKSLLQEIDKKLATTAQNP